MSSKMRESSGYQTTRKPGSALTLLAIILILLMVVSSAQTLTCRTSEFKIGDRCCQKCPPGTEVYEDCTESSRTRCVPCSKGTFMDQQTHRRLCYHCRHCDSGPGLRMKTPCMKTSDTVCEPVEGFYCRESAGGNCWRAEKHSSCRPGEYIRDRGTSTSDTLCSPCSAGTFSDGTSPSCRPHRRCEEENRDLLRPGTGSEDAQCEELQSKGMGAVAVGVFCFANICALVVVPRIYRKWMKQMGSYPGKKRELRKVPQGRASSRHTPTETAGTSSESLVTTLSDNQSSWRPSWVMSWTSSVFHR